MERKHRGQIVIIMMAVLFALAASMLIVLSRSFIKFTGVQNVRYANGRIYGISIHRTRNEIFAMDADTGKGQFLKIEQMGQGGVTSFPALEVSEDGNVYLVRECYRDGDIKSLNLVRWDLRSNHLEMVAEIPYDSKESLIGFVVGEDQWYFLYYTKDASGGAEKKAYALTADGQYYELESTDGVEWDNDISGIAISSLPFDGVYQRTSTIVVHVVLVMLVVLAAEILLWIFCIWWKSSSSKYRSLIRMVGCTTAAFAILITVFNVLMRRGVFDYVSNHKIYSCEVEAEVLSETIDQNFLDDLANDGIDDDLIEAQDILGNHWNLFTGVALYRDNNTVLEGDLFGHGSTETVLDEEGSLKELVDEALRSGKRVSTIYAARRGVNALVLQPVKTESGTEAVICVRSPMHQTLYEAYIIRKHITRVCYAILAGILLIIMVQMLWGQAALGKLRQALDELAAGNLQARANVHGYNELAYAAKEFNRLAERLEKNLGRAELYRRFYESFLPMNLLRKVTDDSFQPPFQAGSSVAAETFLLSLRIPAGTSEKSEGDMPLLAWLVQIVEENGGSVVEFRENGFAAVFTGILQNVLLCAVQLQRKTQEETGKNAWIGMSTGKAEVFASGYEKRREICVKKPAEADILMELSESLNNAMIVTGDAAALLYSGESGFHFRELGQIGFGEYRSSAVLYALMDAELPDVRRKRERTLPNFESGVRAYASGDYFTAREQMIRCLFDDPDDRTARSYCLNCERKEPPAICEAVR